MDEKINLLVHYNFNDTVYVDRLNDPVNPANVGPRAWLNTGPSEGDEEGKVDTRGWEGRRREDGENHFTDYLEGLEGF